MIRPPHALTITGASTVGILMLWMQRVYGEAPLFENIGPAAADSTTTILALIVSGLTTPVTVLIIAVAGALFTAYKHHAKLWWLLFAVLAVGTAASVGLKNIIMLPRPEYALLPLGSYGFPSTHATLATILFIIIIWFSYYWRNTAHRLTLAITGAGWVSICLSRMLLGVHSASDVLAGILLGAAIASLAIAMAPIIFHHYNIKIKRT